MKLCYSPLGVQCEVLSIHVKNRESILILVKNMINLRELGIECEDENFNKRSISNENYNNELRDQTIENKNDLVQWLKDHFLSTCSVARESYSTSSIQIWI